MKKSFDFFRLCTCMVLWAAMVFTYYAYDTVAAAMLALAFSLGVLAG